MFEDKKYAEIKSKLEECEKSGKFMICLAYYSKDNDSKVLTHWTIKDFAKKDDLIPALKHMKDDMKKKHDLEEKTQWI